MITSKLLPFRSSLTLGLVIAIIIVVLASIMLLEKRK